MKSIDNLQLLKNGSPKPLPHSGSWWYYFEKVDSGARAQCLHCDWIVNRGKSKSTYILRYHLQKQHPELYAQKCQFSDTAEDEMAKSSAEINTSNGGESSALDQKPVKAPVKIRQSLAPRSSIAKSIVRTKNALPNKIDGPYYDEGDGEDCEMSVSAHNPLLYAQNSSLFYANDTNCYNEADGLANAEDLFLQQQSTANAEAESAARLEIYALKKRKLQIEIQTGELLQKDARFESEKKRQKWQIEIQRAELLRENARFENELLRAKLNLEPTDKH